MTLGESTTDSAPLSRFRDVVVVWQDKKDVLKTMYAPSLRNKGLVFTDITHILLLFVFHMRARLLWLLLCE